MKNITCFLFGHKKVDGVFEDQWVISTKGCSRCKTPLQVFGPNAHWKGMRNIPCPGLSRESWEQYCDEKEKSLRATH